MIKTFLTIDNKQHLIDINTRKVYVHCEDNNQIYEIVKLSMVTFTKYMTDLQYKDVREIILAQTVQINGEEFINSMTSYTASTAQLPPKI
jgi:hypothetical protein